jgi:hypothetical protein
MDSVRMHWDFARSIEVADVIRRLGRDERASKEEKDHLIPDGVYQKLSKYTFRGREIYFMERPRFFRKGMPPIAVSFHCSKFRNYLEVLSWLHEIFEERTHLIYEAKISRLDLCVDLGLSFDSAFKAVRRVGSRKATYYDSSSGKTLYLGERPFQIVFYEKEVPFHHVDWWAEGKMPKVRRPFVKALRAEARYFGIKCPINSMEDFFQLKNVNPFESLKCEEIDLASMAGVGPHTQRRIESFLYRKDLYGFEIARKEENATTRKFAQNIGQFLTPVKFDFAAAWQHRFDWWVEQKRPLNYNPTRLKSKQGVHNAPQS